MPRLLQINECLNLSTGKIAQQIGDIAIENGMESFIAYSAREQKIQSRSTIIKVGSKWSSYIHYAENLLLDREGLSSRSSTKRLIKQIVDIEPDIVHLHNIHDHWLNYRLLFEYLNSTNIKVVWTFHDCWAFTGHCFHFVTKNCDRWKTQCYDCPLQMDYPKTYVDRSENNYKLKKRLFASNKYLTIVACSEWMANLVHQSFLNGKRIEVIHNGIDLNVFKPSVLKPQDGCFRVLAVSNVWNKEKGYSDILKLRELLPSDFLITIVGLSKKQMASLPSGIRGIERTQNVDELIRLYSESNVLVNPTYADTFPTIIIEALSCDTPVIVYRTGGCPEIVDETTGVVVEQGDVQQLANAIKLLKDNPKESGICRKRAVSHFNNKERFSDYIELYDELLSR